MFARDLHGINNAEANPLVKRVPEHTREWWWKLRGAIVLVQIAR
jgi:hypothetical protein